MAVNHPSPHSPLAHLAPDRPRWPICRPIVQRAAAMLRGEVVPRDSLTEVVLADPTLAAEVVWMARAVSSRVEGKVESVASALQILGRSHLLDRLDALLEESREPRDRRHYLAHLRHAVIASLCAEGLAALLGEVPPDVARLLGLVGPRWPAGLFGEVKPKAGPESITEAWEAARHLPLFEAKDVATPISSLECLLDLAVGMAPRFGAPPAGPARFGTDSGTLLALQEAAAAVQDRVERHVDDGLLVMGSMLGIEDFAADSLIAQLEAQWEQAERRARIDAAVVPALRGAMTRIREARNEVLALCAVREALLDLPLTRAVLVAMSQDGERLFPPGPERKDILAIDDIPGGRDRLLGVGSGEEGLRMTLAASDVVVVPIRITERCVGELILVADGRVDPCVPAAAKNLVRAMEQRIEQIQIETTPFVTAERLRRDGLTGVLTRGAIMERLAAETHRVHRYNSALALMMVDIDLFKEWNDRNGHQVGDEVLSAVGQILQGAIRETDAVGRYGGDEFMILLPGRAEDEAQRVRERISERVAVLAAELKTRFEAPQLSLSIGVTAVREGPIDAATLIFRADHALYRIKESRRRPRPAADRRNPPETGA